ncbi:ventricular zone-expressed PH domain-containing protein homolog 1-like [Physella acuta]|uniref:ventricular zone-expressed PH domain-containing protein homolog 1-like n=1 Tax=Physella acuta TaxID=109671 RepID=UPI0027DCC443|nr:ventricular zone-expressed PH domain-containing protein homolog 1-like [Physella acuta]
MHDLFAQVLSRKDLSKAGELFSLEDDVIEIDLGEIIHHIQLIADTEEYETNDNDQSVVEICITRITTAIRETGRIEKHAEHLVSLLAMCLKHNLMQKSKDVDPPHAKIASDIMSRLFTYYTNNKVMTLAIPCAVKFLECENKDLVRSVASYLSLAAIDNASLLAQHMQLVLTSVLKGNYLLGQVLPQIYEQNPQPVLQHVDDIASLMTKCDSTEKVCLLQLFSKVVKAHPELLEKHIPTLCTYLTSSLLSCMVIMILVDMAVARPEAVVEHLGVIQGMVDTQPVLMYQVAQITGAVGTISQDQAKKSMDYLVGKLGGMDPSILPAVLQEIRGLSLTNHSLLSENMDKISKLSTSGSSSVRLMVQQIRDDVRKHNAAAANKNLAASNDQSTTHSKPTQIDTTREKPKEVRSVSSQTEGTVTIITVGNPPNTSLPSGTVSVKNTTLPPSGASSQQSLAKLSSRISSADHSNSPSHRQTPDGNSFNSVGTSTERIGSSDTMRDGVQLFCEKHFTKIKSFINKLNATIPLPARCSVVKGKHKRYLKLHFECANQSQQCLYSGSHFMLNTRFPKLWVHLMFLSVQARSKYALSQRDADVSCLKSCWDALKGETTSSFLALVTSSFPTQKDQLALLQELHQMRYFDIFELNAIRAHWACFVCNHPEKLSELLNDGCPEIAGQLKEKKGKWMFFKRWKTRYFTLSGGSITYNKSNATKATLPVTKIQSVKAVRKGIRDTPKAFEIFTGDQTYKFKAKGQHNVEQWVQCIHIAVARSHHSGSASLNWTGVRHSIDNGAASGSSGLVDGEVITQGSSRGSSHEVERPSGYLNLFDPPQLARHGVRSSGRAVTDTKL